MLDQGCFGNVNEHTNGLLKTVNNSTEHMFALIGSVLQLEKLRSGKVHLATKPTEIVPFLKRCVDSVSLLAENKETRIEQRYECSDEQTVQADSFWLEQVFANILSNAIKFSPRAATIIVSAKQLPGKVSISVTDTGPGIPPRDLKLIFDRFHRVKGTASVSGTGLGLPIAKELVTMHRGEIFVQSELGEGSTFVVILPMPLASVGEQNSGDSAMLSTPISSANAVASPLAERRPANRTTLLHKGLLLVSVPLIFELSIFGVLLSLQDQVEAESQRVNTKRQLNENANTILRDLISITEGIREKGWREFMVSARFEEYLAAVRKGFAEMKRLAASNERTMRSVEAAEKGFAFACAELASGQERIRAGNYELNDRNATTRKIELPLGEALSMTLLQIGTERRPIDDAPTKRLREEIRLLLKCAILLSVFFACSGVYLYNKNLVSRLSLLNENARRLGKGEPLLPEFGGTDEIAELDTNFHFAAELIDEAKKIRQEVASMITHDLKTPLQTIRSFLELLEAGALIELNKQGAKSLRSCQRACDHMVELIDSVLQLEKLRTGHLQIEALPVELAELLDRCVESVKILAEQKEITIACKYKENYFVILGDEFWLEQVFVNILSNAIKFSPNKSTVVVDAVKAGVMVQISISDEGPGIPPEDLELIFERFHRVQTTSAASVSGTGLGLPIAKELILLHNGTIEVESNGGAGTKFCVSLPQDSEPEFSQEEAISSQQH
jgi:signal transduction histidine kinase